MSKEAIEILEMYKSACDNLDMKIPAHIETFDLAIKALRNIDKIEEITREAFNNPETQDINLYRAQALANILAVFEYDGATIKEDA